jgi:hypothetical protein
MNEICRREPGEDFVPFLARAGPRPTKKVEIYSNLLKKMGMPPMPGF